jgi:NitT/TauT family transport system permease protein
MRSILLAAFGVGLTLLAWECAALAINIPLLVPSPATVARSAWALTKGGELGQHVVVSLGRLLVALAIGVPAGAIVGCALGRWEILDAAVNPFIRMFNAIPAIALVPFSLLWLGVTETSRYALLFYTVALTVLLSARQGVRSVPPLRLKAGAALGVTGTAAFLRIVLPSCIPAIVIGVRTAIGLGVMVIVAAEMLGAENGVGFLIMQARSHFNVANMAVGVICLGFLSVLLDRTFNRTIETLMPRWSVRRRIR